MTGALVILGGIAVLAVVLLFLPVWLKSRKVNLTKTGDEKPAWMRTLPPAETQAALQEDKEGMAVYDYDPGENVAAPFAEQIEDILRTELKANPYLEQFEIDLGSAADGTKRTGIEQVADALAARHCEQVVRPFHIDAPDEWIAPRQNRDASRQLIDYLHAAQKDAGFFATLLREEATAPNKHTDWSVCLYSSGQRLSREFLPPCNFLSILTAW
ncbi:MAG: hypothetical protein Fur0043_15790 [Anaerolineales bacterium]